MSLNFLHNYTPDPVIFSIGPIEIYWYGFLMSLSMIIGILLAQHIGKKYQVDKEKIFDLCVYLIVFGLLGARIYYLFLEYNYFLNNPLAVFKVWEGGLAIHGAIIGGLLAGYIYTRGWDRLLSSSKFPYFGKFISKIFNLHARISKKFYKKISSKSENLSQKTIPNPNP